ncbi:hypothetical protein H2204_007563 [Knufia peltigerae]|nr:hypothetical protein H2204_007563 [Knufia peltigerae]
MGAQDTKSRVTDDQRARFKKQFYSPHLPERFEAAKQILEQYSGIPADEVNKHVLRIRDQGWAILPFPCIGQFRFLELERTITDPRYQATLTRLRHEGSTDALLDVGCFVGQIVRALAFNGADPARLYGTDLEQAYLDLGFDLFRDSSKLDRSHFVAGDMLLEPRDPRLDLFMGKMTIIHASSFFHLFNWSLQIKAAKRCVEFMNPDVHNVMVFGGMIGREEPGDIHGPGQSKLFMHNAASWARLWEEVGEATGTRWRTEFEFVDDEAFRKDNPHYANAGIKRVRFGTYRIDRSG